MEFKSGIMMGWNSEENKPFIGFDVGDAPASKVFHATLEYEDLTAIQNTCAKAKDFLREQMDSPGEHPSRLPLAHKITMQTTDPENPAVQARIELTDRTILNFMILPDQYEELINVFQVGKQHAEQVMAKLGSTAE